MFLTKGKPSPQVTNDTPKHKLATCWSGSFRMSCDIDGYCGPSHEHRVDPVYRTRDPEKMLVVHTISWSLVTQWV